MNEEWNRARKHINNTTVCLQMPITDTNFYKYFCLKF